MFCEPSHHIDHLPGVANVFAVEKHHRQKFHYTKNLWYECCMHVWVIANKKGVLMAATCEKTSDFFLNFKVDNASVSDVDPLAPFSQKLASQQNQKQKHSDPRLAAPFGEKSARTGGETGVIIRMA